MSDLLGFVCYNEIRDYIRGREGDEDREDGGEVKAEERGSNNNERWDIGGGDIGDYYSEGIADFIIVLLISTPPLLLSSIFSR